jgi:hypothetical protein
MKSWLALPVLLAVVLALPAAGAPLLKHHEIMRLEAAWIESLQQPSGALTTQRDAWPRAINPYFANFAATALTRDTTRLEVVKKYILWYLGHLNWPDHTGLHGTVYDHEVLADGTERSKGRYDSADSYAATFISLLRAYYEASGDADLLKANRYAIDIIGGVMVSLMDPSDHLTFAMRGSGFKYLMDNCEVYKGLADLAWLFRNVFAEPQGADWYQVHADNVKNAVLTELSNGASFYVYKEAAGKKAVDWSIWYSHGVSQLFPLLFGVIAPDSQRARALYAELNEHHAGWESANKDFFPWAIVGYAAVLLGDLPRAETFSARMRTQYVDAGHPYPWHVAEAGWLLRMNSRMCCVH